MFKCVILILNIQNQKKEHVKQQQQMKQATRSFFRFGSNIATEQELQYFKGLRIYKNKSLPNLVKQMVINRAFRYNFIVDNSHSIYSTLVTLLGAKAGNYLVEQTVGQVFTAGNSLAQLEQYLNRQKDLQFIIDYCCEALEGKENNSNFLNQNAEVMKNTIETCGKMTDKEGMIIAIKVSGICEKNSIVQMNEGKKRIIQFFSDKIDTQKSQTIEQIFTKLELEGCRLTEQDKSEFIEILGLKQGENTVDFTRWLYKVHSFYLYKSQYNKNKIIQHFSKLSAKEMIDLDGFVKRFNMFLDPMVNTKLRGVIDAEQTYFQLAIDSVTEQAQDHYNKGTIKIMSTLQCYLKSSTWKMDYELQKTQTFNQPFGMKFVRGAYLVEENKIAQKEKQESPICNSLQETHNNYNKSIEKYFKAQIKDSEVVIASHNVESSVFVKQLMKEYNMAKNTKSVLFAQLYGLADQLTYKLKEEVIQLVLSIFQGYQVAKYVPFGATEIMIPYLIRRAQESKQMLESANQQSVLLNDEFKKRIFN